MSPGPCMALGDSMVMASHGGGPVADVSSGSCASALAAGSGSSRSRGDTWSRDSHDPLVAPLWPVARNPAPGRRRRGHRHPRRQPELPVTHRDGGHGHRQHKATLGTGPPPSRGAQPQRSLLQTCPQPPHGKPRGPPKDPQCTQGMSGPAKQHFGDKSGPACTSGSIRVLCRALALWRSGASGRWGLRLGSHIPSRPIPFHLHHTPPSFSAPPRRRSGSHRAAWAHRRLLLTGG